MNNDSAGSSRTAASALGGRLGGRRHPHSTFHFEIEHIPNDNSNRGFGLPAEIFEKFSKNFRKFLYKSFVWSFARSFENFSKFSSRRRDRFGPKIVKFRAILAIFRPFEDFRNGAETKHLNSIRAAGPPKGPCSSNRIQMLQSSLDLIFGPFSD